MKNIQQTANVAQNDLALHAIINSSNYANVVGQVFVVQMWWAVWGGLKKNPKYKQVLISLLKNDQLFDYLGQSLLKFCIKGGFP